MPKVTAVIRSTGTFTDKNNPDKKVPYDNFVFHLDTGNQLFQNEKLICGEGKPTQIKVKVEDYNKLCKIDPSTLLGKEIHFYYENQQLVQITIKEK